MTVVVVGGANIDIIAMAAGAPQPQVSNPGRIRVGAGGAGRNVAENLRRLGVATRFIAAVDAHSMVDFVIEQTARAGVDTSGVVRVAGRGNYYVAIEVAGVVEWAVNDMAAAETLTPGNLDALAGVLRAAEAVVVDANLTPATIQRAVELAGNRLVLLPVSVAKCRRMRGVLPDASLLVLTAAEASALSGSRVVTETDALRAAHRLRASEKATVVITMADRGLGWVGRESFWVSPHRAVVVDASGAGDAVAAVAIYAMLAGLDDRMAARLAMAASAMTVAVEGATHPGLSLAVLQTQE